MENFHVDNLSQNDIDTLHKLLGKMLGNTSNTVVDKTQTENINIDVPIPEVKPSKKQNTPKRSRKRVKKVSQSHRSSRDTKGRQDKRPCRVEPINTEASRTNLFVDDDLNDKQERELSKTLTGNNQPVKRRTTNLITVYCKICGSEHQVSPSVVYKDGGEIVYTCNKCCKRRG